MPTFKNRTSATIAIKRMAGTTETTVLTVPITKASRRTFKLMEKDEIMLSFSIDEAIRFKVGDYVNDELFGKFVVMQEQTPSNNKSTGGYDYQLILVAPYRAWNNHEFTLTNASASPNSVRRTECSWSLTDNLKANVREFIRCLSAIGEKHNSQPYCMQIHNTATYRDELSLMTYDSLSMCKALDAMAETWHCEWWVTYEIPDAATGDILIEADANETAVTGNTERGIIHFGMCNRSGDAYLFNERPVVVNDVTCDTTVETMTAQRNDSEHANRLFVLGGTQNLPESYRKTLVLQVDSIAEDGQNQRYVYLPNRKLTEDMLNGAVVNTETISVNQPFDVATRTKTYGEKLCRVSMSTAAWQFNSENQYTKVEVEDIRVCVKFPSQVTANWTLKGNAKIYRCTNGENDTLIYDYKVANNRWLIDIQHTQQSSNEEFCIGVTTDYNFTYSTPIYVAANTFDRIKVEVEIETNNNGLQIIDTTSTYETKIVGYAAFSYEKRTATNRILTTVNGEEVEYNVLFNPSNFAKPAGEVVPDGNYYYHFAIDSDDPDWHPSDPIMSVGQEFTLLGYNPVAIPLSWYTDDSDNPASLVGFGERRLRLPVPTGDDSEDIVDGIKLCNDYIERTGIAENSRIELTVKNDDIYPRCYLKVTQVTTERRTRTQKLSDNSEQVWPYDAYVLKVTMLDGSAFPFKESFVREGDKLRALFISDVDEQKAYEEEEAGDQPSTADRLLLAGMEFDTRWDDIEKTFTLLTNDDYGAMFPNSVCYPSVNDVFVLTGWDVRAMEDLNLISKAETRLLTFARAYMAELERGQFTFSCDMMSGWAKDIHSDSLVGLHLGNGSFMGQTLPKMLLPLEGGVALVKNTSLPDGQMLSRILGYEFKMDFPWDTPRYTIGETEAYSRIKALERSLTKAGSGGGSGSVSYSGGSLGGSGTLTLVTGTDINVSIADLADVKLQDLETGQTLVWNGSKWVNATNESSFKELVFVDLWLSQQIAYNNTIWDGTSLYYLRKERVNIGGFLTDTDVKDIISLRPDVIYVDKQHNTPYRWTGSVMVALSEDVTVTAGSGLITINGITLDLSHGHDWGDLVDKPNLVEGVIIGKNGIKFRYTNGDIVVADFSTIASRVSNLETWIWSEYGADNAIHDLQNDIAEVKTRHKVIRLDKIITESVTIEQVSAIAVEGATYALCYSTVVNSLLVERTLDNTVKYYNSWAELNDIIRDRAWYDIENDLFVSVDGENCICWAWDDDEQALLPTGTGGGSDNRVGVITPKWWDSTSAVFFTWAVGDYWFDTSEDVLKICTAVSPTVFEEVEGNEYEELLLWNYDEDKLYRYNPYQDVLVRQLDAADLSTINTAIGGKVADVKVNNSSVVDANKVANITVPTKTGDLINNSNFATTSQVNTKVADVKVNGFSVVDSNKIANITILQSLIVPKCWSDDSADYNDWEVGDYWWDTSEETLKICTATNPVTFLQVEGEEYDKFLLWDINRNKLYLYDAFIGAFIKVLDAYDRSELNTAIAGKVADVRMNNNSIVNPTTKIANFNVAGNVTQGVSNPVSSDAVYNRIAYLRKDILGKVLTPEYWQTTEPSEPSDGEYWLNEDDIKLYVYNEDDEVWYEIDGDVDHPLLLHNLVDGYEYFFYKGDGIYSLGSYAPVQGVKVNGTSVVNFAGIANINVPTKTSDISNDSGFVTSADITSAVNAEATARQTADNNLQAAVNGKVSGVKVNGTSVVNQSTKEADIPVTASGNGIVKVAETDLNVSHNHDWGSIVNTPNMLVGIGAGEGKLTFYRANGDVDEVSGLFNRVEASVVGGHGTPSVEATCIDGLLKLKFYNIQGEQGLQGDVILYDPTTAATYTLYNVTGLNVDGAMTQRAVTEALTEKMDVVASRKDFSIEDEEGQAIVIFENGHIKTKNFDSEHIDITHPVEVEDGSYDFSIEDEEGNALVALRKGHIKTKEFNSEDFRFQLADGDYDFSIEDENGKVVAQFAKGHIKTKYFDSSNFGVSKTIYCIGDSLTQGQSGINNPRDDVQYGASQNCYPNILQEMMGDSYKVVNLGVGGQTTGEILARCGFLDLIVKTSFTLYGNGSTSVLCSGVQGGASGVTVDSCCEEYANYFMQQGSEEAVAQMTLCYINGVACSLSYSLGNILIKRVETASYDMVVPVGAHITFSGNKGDGIYLLRMGTNDVLQVGSNTNVDNYIAKLKQATSRIPDGRFIVMGMFHGYEYTTSQYPVWEAMNAKLAKEFGARYIDGKNYIISAAAFAELGVTPTTDSDISSSRAAAGVVSDTYCIAHGMTPSSFWRSSNTASVSSVDKIHLNYDGYCLMAKMFYDKMRQLNFI